MLIIEGRNGKSKVVQNMLFLDKNYLILDSARVNSLQFNDQSVHYDIPKDYTLVELEHFLNDAISPNFDTVVLLLNVEEENIKELNRLSYKFFQYNFILTVQSDGEIKQYNV